MRDPLPWLILAGALSLIAVGAVIWALRIARTKKNRGKAIALGLIPLVLAVGAWGLASLYEPPLAIDTYTSQLNDSVVKFRDQRDRTPKLASSDWPKELYGAVGKNGKRLVVVSPDLIATIGNDTGLIVTAKPDLKFSSMVIYRRQSPDQYAMYSVAYKSQCVEKKKCSRIRHTWRICTMGDALTWWRPSDCAQTVTRITSSDQAKAARSIRGLRADRG